jgi:hypothetical protein
MSRRGEGQILRVRSLVCRRCGLRVKSEERLAVPWNERELVAQVKALLPEDLVVALWEKGVTELPLTRLNAQLAPHGVMVHASKGYNSERAKGTNIIEE